jgi:predicted membrane channel-forming protein YqfA (hemolysin III family)
MSLTDARKEQIKLQANFLNGIAIGIILIGTFTPITRALYDPTIQKSTLGIMAVLAILCVGVGSVLHYHATRRLDALQESDQ